MEDNVLSLRKYPQQFRSEGASCIKLTLREDREKKKSKCGKMLTFEAICIKGV